MILLVEDNREVGKSVIGALELRGLKVLGWATTLAEAREFTEERADQITAVICDYELPDGNGTSFLETIAGTGIKTILYSGLDRSREVKREMSQEPDYVLTKSDINGLFEALKS